MENNLSEELKENKPKSLNEYFEKIGTDIRDFIEKNEKGNLLEFTNISMHENINLENGKDSDYLFFFLTIIHFYSISEINGVLFSLLEEIKKYFKILRKDGYEDKNFLVFFKYLVYYDSSQINFNYLSSILSIPIINLIDVTATYFISWFFNLVVLVALYFIHILDFFDLNSNDFDSFMVVTILYILLYIFTGLVGLLPFQILKNKNNLCNNITINLCSLIGVLLKTVIHFYLFKLKNDHIILLIKVIIFLIFSVIYNVSLKNIKISERYNYLFGKFSYKTELFTIQMKFRGFWEDIRIIIYITWPMIFLDFFTRSQKIMFKSIFKDKFNNSEYMYYAIISCFFFYIITMSLINCCLPKDSKNPSQIIIKDDTKKIINDGQNDNNEFEKIKKEIKKREKINKKKENYIYLFILIANGIFLICLLLYFYLIPSKWFCFIGILFGGTINYILTDYYSTQKVEFLSLSGILSISQIIFRILEFFKNDSWIIFELICSAFGILIPYALIIYNYCYEK